MLVAHLNLDWLHFKWSTHMWLKGIVPGAVALDVGATLENKSGEDSVLTEE